MKKNRIISGWGGTKVSRALTIENLYDRFLALSNRGSKFTVFGSLTSYGDSAVNNHGFYFSSELLKNIEINVPESAAHCGGGVTYGELLRETLKYGLIPKVVPGTNRATIGGSIAADAHGKSSRVPNCVSNSVTEIELLGIDGLVHLSASNIEDAQLMASTIGGLGSTGLVLSAKLPLESIKSDTVLESRVKCHNLKKTLREIQNALAESDYVVCWVDLSNRKSFRAIISSARINEVTTRNSQVLYRFSRRLFITLEQIQDAVGQARGLSLIFRWNLKIVNYFLFLLTKKSRVITLQEYLFPMHKLVFWRQMHGREGLTQWQRIIPFESEAYLETIVNEIQSSKYLPTLVTIKISQEYSKAILGYVLPGWNIAIDFKANQTGLIEFLKNLDEIVFSAGGRPYLIKDNYLTSEQFERFYPRARDLKTRKDMNFIPNWVQSDQLSRFGLVDDRFASDAKK